MSTGSAPGIIALSKLNFELQGGVIHDLTSSGLKAEPSAGCTPVETKDMSLCMNFTGDDTSFIVCKPPVIKPNTPTHSVFQNGITITAWVRFENLTDKHYLLALGCKKSDETLETIGFYTSGNQLYYSNGDNTPFQCSEVLKTDRWYHLAIAVDDQGKAQFYVDGQASNQVSSAPLAPLNLNGEHCWQTIGFNNDLAYFNGHLAWMAIYNGALGEAGIKADLVEGESKRYTSFRQSFPVDFKLNSDDGGAESPILFIESQGNAKDLHFRLLNTGKKPINFFAPSPAITKASDITNENYHVQLRFRPGILAENYINENASGDALKLGSEMSADWLGTLKKDPIGTYSMSFLYTGSTQLTIPPQGEELIIIKEVNASAAQGSRNTNVEFQYQNVLPGQSPVTTGTNATVPMMGHRVQNLSIVNHAGVKDIALRAEIIGPSIVSTYSGAADETPPSNSLKFQLVNTGSTPLDLGLPSSEGGATEFTLTIDIQPADYTAEWALIDHGVGNKLTLALDDGESGWNADTAGSAPTGNPNQLQWTITNQTVQSFATGKGLTFTLSGIECSLPAGSTKVTIGYSHIPGHWQGAFELPVTKSPLSFTRSKVGINIQEPEATLHIVEEQGTIPLEVKSPGSPNATIQAPFTLPSPGASKRLILIDPALQAYLDSEPITGGVNDENLFFYRWTIKGPGASEQSRGTIIVPHFDGTANNYTFTAFACPPYVAIYYSANNPPLSEKVAFFRYSGFNQLNFVGEFEVFDGASAAVHNGYAFAQSTATDTSICIYNISANNTLPDFKLSTITGGNSGTVSMFAVYGGRLFFAYKPLDNNRHQCVYSCLIGTNASLGGPVKVLESEPVSPTPNNNTGSIKGPMVFYGNYIYCQVRKNSTYYVEIANISTNQSAGTLDIGATEATGLHVYENYLLVLFNTQTDIYVLTEPGAPVLLKSFPTGGQYDAGGMAGSYMWTSHEHSDATWTTKLYDIKTFVEQLSGLGSYLSSTTLSIGTTGSMTNVSLNLPYPSTQTQSGIVIGDVSKVQPAGLAMSVGGSGVNPINIADESGNPIFNIKLPTGKGIGAGDYRVGIGLDSPQAPLHIAGGIQTNIGLTAFAYLFYKGPSGFNNGAKVLTGANNGFPFSIVTTEYIQASGYVAVSDCRIKDAITQSEASEDLKKVLGIKVSDYQYIDFVGKGTGQKKGLIAQQVKEVFPQAVSDQNTDFIPDIYAMATDVGWQPITQHLRVSLEKAHDLKVGDKVRLMADKGFEEKEVVAVPNDKTFIISEWEKPVEKLFVYGKEVHDFHTVDYDQVAMLGVSAIQALHAEVESLKKENEALKSQMQTEMAELKDEWAAFKASITKQHQN